MLGSFEKHFVASRRVSSSSDVLAKTDGTTNTLRCLVWGRASQRKCGP